LEVEHRAVDRPALGGAAGGDVLADVERRTPAGALLLREREELVVETVAVLDRAATGDERVLDALASERVRSHLAVQLVRFVADRAQLVGREGEDRVQRAVA